MIIDCHTHIGRNDHIKATAEDLLNSMDKAGIDKSLVFAGEINDCPNEWMLEQIEPHRDRLLGVACATPKSWEDVFTQSTKAEQITKLYKEKKIVACKFYTGYDHYYPADAKTYLSTFERAGLPVIFHSGDCLCTIQHAKLKYSHPLHIDEIAVDYPKLNIIIAHMGFPWHRDAAEVCYKNPNVWADVSGFVYGEMDYQQAKQFEKVINEFRDICSIDKLLFGTDFPISDPASYVSMMEGFMPAWALYDNVIKAFKL